MNLKNHQVRALSVLVANASNYADYEYTKSEMLRLLLKAYKGCKNDKQRLEILKLTINGLLGEAENDKLLGLMSDQCSKKLNMIVKLFYAGSIICGILAIVLAIAILTA